MSNCKPSGCALWSVDGAVRLVRSYGLAIAALVTCLAGLWSVAGAAGPDGEPARGIAEAELKSGSAFVAPYIRVRQDDPIANPGMLWVDEGAKLWRKAAGDGGKACSTCHGALSSMNGVAARYPAWDEKAGRLFSLETRIQNCRRVHQKAAALEAESDALLSLSTAIAHQSRGMAMTPSIDGLARKPFDEARKLYYSRIGQLNLSCAHCHERNWGKRLYAETVSQGHGNGYPTYRVEWQTIGSLYRRLRGCFNSVRARPPVHGSAEHVGLELFLAWRAKGLPIETPAVRR